jgi:hypothetical protein
MGGTGGEPVAFLKTNLIVNQTAHYNSATLRAEITSNIVFRAIHLGGGCRLQVTVASYEFCKLTRNPQLVTRNPQPLNSNKLQSEYPRNFIDIVRHVTYAQRAMVGWPFIAPRVHKFGRTDCEPDTRIGIANLQNRSRNRFPFGHKDF